MCTKNRKTVISIVSFILCAAFLWVMHMNFGIVIVQGNSMMPYFHDNQVLLSVRNPDAIFKNNVIVFCDYEQETCIKRVIAVPGDTVVLKNNKIEVNGYGIGDIGYDGENKTYQLGENEYFVVGDNWKNSCDSRTYGPIHADQIQSRII